MIRKPAAVLLVLSLAVLALALVPAAGLAAKGGNGGGGGKPGGGGGGKPGGGATGSFSLVLLNSTDGVPHWGQDVTFNVSTTATWPFVDLECYQGGSLVLRQGAGFYAGYPFSQVYTLENWMWTGGAADCNARLYSTNSDGSNPQTLATMSFHVYA